MSAKQQETSTRRAGTDDGTSTQAVAPFRVRQIAPPRKSAWFKNARFRVTVEISARTLIGPALERVCASPCLPGRTSVPREPSVPQKIQPVGVRLTRQEDTGYAPSTGRNRESEMPASPLHDHQRPAQILRSLGFPNPGCLTRPMTRPMATRPMAQDRANTSVLARDPLLF